ncbi:MAG TPA: extradiol ring-cleavage dioxygenase [Chloroflexota bacterium]|nr:extradiol ring-cleavage dioxygenase [Chloroflexota bacterium]
MARIVLGLAASHSPQVSVPWTEWHLLREKDETDPRLDYPALLRRARPGLEEELTPAKWQERYAACQQAVATLGQVLREAAPDVIVVLGDDQHEQFLDDNLPAVAIYHGRSIPVRRPAEARGWKAAEAAHWAETAEAYPAAPELAEYLIEALTLEEFDVARSNRLREEVGIGHAFSFLYRRLWPDTTVPVVPIMLNTYYPPNQPTPKRCYALGRALRRALEAWDGDTRVAVMASGGLSHVILDEALDRVTLEALQQKDAARLCALPRAKLRGGTSEILSWVALAGATEPMAMTLLTYTPGYRSPAATGCGMAFAYWQ